MAMGSGNRDQFIPTVGGRCPPPSSTCWIRPPPARCCCTCLPAASSPSPPPWPTTSASPPVSFRRVAASLRAAPLRNPALPLPPPNRDRHRFPWWGLGKPECQALVCIRAQSLPFVRQAEQLFRTPYERILEHALEFERAVPEEYREEMRALAEAAGVDYREIAALNTFLDTDCLCEAETVWCVNAVARGEATADGSLLHTRRPRGGVRGIPDRRTGE